MSKFVRKSENVSEIWRKSKTGGKCIMVSGGMDAPVYRRENKAGVGGDGVGGGGGGGGGGG